MKGICFVTGGSGFVGGRLIKHLIAQGWQVRALARNDEGIRIIKSLGAEPIRGSLNDEISLVNALRGSVIVVHAAALFKLWGAQADFEEANVHGTDVLLKAAQVAGVKRFIQIGAAAVVMGDMVDIHEANESLPRQERSWAPYAASKARSEKLVLSANQAHIFETIVIRPPMIWGEGMPMLQSILENIQSGDFRLINDGSAVMSTVHVDNLCHAVELAIDKGKGGQAYFVSDDINHRFKEILTAFLGSQNVELPKSSIPLGIAWFMASMMEGVWKLFSRKGEPPITRQLLRFIGKDFILDISKAQHDLGYRQITSWSVGIEAMKKISY